MEATSKAETVSAQIIEKNGDLSGAEDIKEASESVGGVWSKVLDEEEIDHVLCFLFDDKSAIFFDLDDGEWRVGSVGCGCPDGPKELHGLH